MGFFNKSHALIIGINEIAANNSPVEKLTNAVNDAKAIQTMLESSCEFPSQNITFLENNEATKDKIGEAVQNFSDKIKENDRFLLFFAGHAKTRESHARVEKQGYLIPYDAKWNNITPKWNTLYPIDELVREVVDNISAKQILFLLDCCFSGIAGKPGTFSYSGMNKENMIEAASRQSVQIFTASSKDEKILDSGSNTDHSMFTQVIIDVVTEIHPIEYPEQFLSASKLASKVTDKVLFESLGLRNRQSPQFYRRQPPDDNGEYVLKTFPASEYSSVENPFLFAEEDQLLREAELLHLIHNDDTFRQIVKKLQ